MSTGNGLGFEFYLSGVGWGDEFISLAQRLFGFGSRESTQERKKIVRKIFSYEVLLYE